MDNSPQFPQTLGGQFLQQIHACLNREGDNKKTKDFFKIIESHKGLTIHIPSHFKNDYDVLQSQVRAEYQRFLKEIADKNGVNVIEIRRLISGGATKRERGKKTNDT